MASISLTLTSDGRETYLMIGYTAQKVMRDNWFAINEKSTDQQSQAEGPEVRYHCVKLVLARELNSIRSQERLQCLDSNRYSFLWYMVDQSTY